MSEALLDVIIVHFRAPELLKVCLEALQTDLEASSISGRIMVVDNDASITTKELVVKAGAIYLDPGSNLGYGAAINFGMARSESEYAVFMNPDVLVHPGCLQHLLEALQTSGIAGPHLTLDQEGSVLHPPGSRRTALDDILEVLSTRSRWVAKWSRRLYRRRAQVEWNAERLYPTPHLCGAIIAYRRSSWDEVGVFDEGFRLYFEENDWLTRANKRGVSIVKENQARATHLHNQCCQHQPMASDWFLESQALYRRRHYGAWFEPLISLLQRLPVYPDNTFTELPEPHPSLPDNLPVWLELSNTTHGFPYSAMLIETKNWSLPDSFWQRLVSGNYFLRIVSIGGEELAYYRVQKP